VEVQRAVQLILLGGVTLKGINLNRYYINPTQLQDASVVSANGNYLQNLGPGIIPMTRYYGGADLTVSLPHFLGTNLASITANLDPTSTINPVDSFDVHKTYVDIEPYTGKAMSARKRLQVNLMLSTSRFVVDGPYGLVVKNYTNPLAPLIVPIVWAEEGADISDSDAASFVSAIYGTRTLANNAMIGGIVAGGAFGIAMVFLACCLHRRNKGAQSKSSGGRLSEDYMGGTTL